MRLGLILLLTACVAALAAIAQEKVTWKVTEGDYVARDFKFRSGESLAELKLHYRTLGTPQRDAQGRVTNAVLILHGTGGSGAQFLLPQFANELYGTAKARI